MKTLHFAAPWVATLLPLSQLDLGLMSTGWGKPRAAKSVDGNPLLELNLPNFILLPHIAWASDTAMQALADQLIANIEAFVRGEPRNLVT